MGCGASTAAQVINTPHSQHLDAEPEKETQGVSADKRDGPSSIHHPLQETGLVRSAQASTAVDELEGLLAALEQGAEAQSDSRDHHPNHQQQQLQERGAVEELLRELDTPAPPSVAPTSDQVQGKSSARVLAPLKIHGRAPTTAAVLLTKTPAPLRPSQPSQQWGAETVAEEPPDSATLITLEHRNMGGGGAGAERPGWSSSVGSPSTAGTTYITFDLLEEEQSSLQSDAADSVDATQSSRGESEVRTNAAQQGKGAVPLSPRWVAGGGNAAVAQNLEQTASEVDELLRDVFEEERTGNGMGGRAEGTRRALDGSRWDPSGEASGTDATGGNSSGMPVSATAVVYVDGRGGGEGDSSGQGGASTSSSGSRGCGGEPSKEERLGPQSNSCVADLQKTALPQEAHSSRDHEPVWVDRDADDAEHTTADIKRTETQSGQAVPGRAGVAYDVLLDVDDLEGMDDDFVAAEVSGGWRASPLDDGGAGAGARVASVAARLSVRVGADEGESDEWWRSGDSNSMTRRRSSASDAAVGTDEQWAAAGVECGGDVLVLDTWDLEDEG